MHTGVKVVMQRLQESLSNVSIDLHGPWIYEYSKSSLFPIAVNSKDLKLFLQTNYGY